MTAILLGSAIWIAVLLARSVVEYERTRREVGKMLERVERVDARLARAESVLDSIARTEVLLAERLAEIERYLVRDPYRRH